MLQSISAKIENFYRKLPDSLYNFSQWHLPDAKIRYLNTLEILRRYINNRKLDHKIYTLDELKKRKKSDTIFVLGCNKSVNEIEDAIWDKINEHDSIGFNYWLFHKFAPTYYGIEYGHDRSLDKHHYPLIKKRSADYSNTIFLVNTRARRRGMTPRLIPEFFPPAPKVAYFLFPKLVHCPESREFRPEDFKKTMFYRGSLNLYLYFARLMDYKKIVLVGCEMTTSTTFYEDWPEAQWIFEIDGYVKPKEDRAKMLYGGAYSSKGKHRFVDAILAVNEFVFKPEEIELYVFNNESLLYPDVPLFEF